MKNTTKLMKRFVFSGISLFLLSGFHSFVNAQTIVGNISIARPIDIVIHPGTNTVYVANDAAPSQVYIIDGNTDAVTGNIVLASRTSDALRGQAIDVGNNLLYVTRHNLTSSNVSVVDLGNLPAISNLSAGSNPHDVAINPTSNKIYVANANSATVSVFDRTTRALLKTIYTGPGRALGVAVNTTTNKVYVATEGGNAVRVIDGVMDAVIVTITTGGSGVNDVVVHEGLNRIYASNRGSSSIAVIDGTSNVLIKTIGVPPGPRGMDINPSTGRVYVACTSGYLAIIDVVSNLLVATLGTGPNAHDAEVNRQTGKVYVANLDGGRVTVVQDITAPSNQPPEAVDDEYSVREDNPLEVSPPEGVLGNDSDADNDPLTAVLVNPPTNGLLSFNPDGTFTYEPSPAFNGSDIFTYAAFDGTSESNVATVTITVIPVNDAPSFVAGSDQIVLENSGLQTVPNWATDISAGPADETGQALTFNVSNNNNGLFSVQPSIDAFATLRYTPAADANGFATVTVSLTDDGGTANGGMDTSPPQTFTITVSPVNEPPVAQNDAYSFALHFEVSVEVPPPGVLANDSDADGDPLTALLVDPPSNGVLDLSPDGSFSYHPDPVFSGTDRFTYKANDGTDDSNVARVTIEIIRVNEAPVAEDDAFSVNENETLMVPRPGVLINDFDADGDPLTVVLVSSSSNGVLTLNVDDGSFTYTPNADFSGSDRFTYKVFDSIDESNEATVTITVIPVNNPPTADAEGPYNVDEGSSILLTASGSDPDGDPLTYAWDLDNNGSFETSGQSVTFSAAELDGPSTQTIIVRVTDPAALSGTAATTVDVLNVAPTVQAGPDLTINEGDAVSRTMTFNDRGTLDTHTAQIDWGDETVEAGTVDQTANTVSGSHVYADNGIYTVTVTVTDDDGASGSGTFVVTVNNVAPAVGAITAPLDPVEVTTEIIASADFTDPGMLDTHTAIWNWGDNSTSPGTVNETNGSGSVTGSHTYTSAGVYTVTLIVTDDDGGNGGSFFQFVVVFDPSAGFVTGGGWIDSPDGACQLTEACENATGKANFGFVSKYKKGANVPTGETEFQFKAANLKFHSTSYEWLVVAGARAKFKGDGTINQTGNYGFMLTAIDGQVNGGGGSDKFRIKIWNKDDEDAIVYDNQQNQADDSDAATELGGGSIVIHSKPKSSSSIKSNVSEYPNKHLAFEDEIVIPEDYVLEQNYPNPFNPETEIRFQLPEASHIVVRIFNTLGQEIRRLADTQYEAGYHRLRWDGRDENGNSVSSGVYLYQMQTGDFVQVRKMSLLR